LWHLPSESLFLFSSPCRSSFPFSSFREKVIISFPVGVYFKGTPRISSWDKVAPIRWASSHLLPPPWVRSSSTPQKEPPTLPSWFSFHFLLTWFFDPPIFTVESWLRPFFLFLLPTDRFPRTFLPLCRKPPIILAFFSQFHSLGGASEQICQEFLKAPFSCFAPLYVRNQLPPFFPFKHLP